MKLEQEIALALWRTLRVALQADTQFHGEGVFYPKGGAPVQIGMSAREGFLYWMDSIGNKIKECVQGDAGETPEMAVRLFREIYGDGPFTDEYFDERRFRNYACRPRIINSHLMFEFRCFDGAMRPATAFHTAEDIVRVWPIK
jgi:hypothetical protein